MRIIFRLSMLCVCLSVMLESEQNSSVAEFYITQSEGQQSLTVSLDTTYLTNFNFSVPCENKTIGYLLSLSTPKESVLKLTSNPTVKLNCSEADTIGNRSYFQGVLEVGFDTGNIGITSINFGISRLEESVYEEQKTVEYDVFVIRPHRTIDSVFQVLVYMLQVLVTIGFGVELDLEVVKENLKRPIAPAIGLIGQFIVMPLIAFTLAKLVIKDDPVVAFGVFVVGCVPGGFGSNTYSFLLNGDISLSITMTSISIVVALGALPLWVYTLGSTFLDEDVSVPFTSVAISLGVLIVPLFIGAFTKHKFPKVAKAISKIFKPVLIICAIIFITIGIYSRFYLFKLFEARLIACACLLPYIGYLLGGGIATIGRQSWTKIKTIAIETGMQNALVAYVLVTTSFSAPRGDLAGVAPVASGFLTPIPLLIATIIYISYRKCKQKKDPVQKKEGKEKISDPIKPKEKNESYGGIQNDVALEENKSAHTEKVDNVTRI